MVARRQYQPFFAPEPPESWRWQERSFADRPDDLNGPQIHIYYAEPSDAPGHYDKIGYISAAVQDAQRWLAARTDQGRAFRIDTYQGRPDVTTLPLDVTTAEMQAANLAETIFDTPLLPGGVSLTALGRRDPNKLHFVFIAAPPALSEDSGRITCGVAAPWTGVAVMFSGRPFLPQHGNSYCRSETNIFLHEVFHLLGAIHPDAPHADGTGHVAYIPFALLALMRGVLMKMVIGWEEQTAFRSGTTSCIQSRAVNLNWISEAMITTSIPRKLRCGLRPTTTPCTARFSQMGRGRT